MKPFDMDIGANASKLVVTHGRGRGSCGPAMCNSAPRTPKARTIIRS